MVYTNSKILCMILHGNDFMHVLEHYNDAGMPWANAYPTWWYGIIIFLWLLLLLQLCNNDVID